MSVAWNRSAVEYMAGPGAAGAPGEGRWFICDPSYAFMEGVATRNGAELALLLYPSYYMEYANGYAVVARGDEISLDYLRNSADLVAYADFDDHDGFRDGQFFTGTVSVKEGASLYLAIITQDYNYRFMYGWVELAIDGDGRLCAPSSAFNFGGDGSLVVGSTPEPGGSVLLLLGAAFLGLRRNRPRATRGRPPLTSPSPSATLDQTAV